MGLLLHFCLMRYFCLLLAGLFIWFVPSLQGQSAYLPLGSQSMHMMDRFEIKSGKLTEAIVFNTLTKAYRRQSIASYVDSFNVSGVKLSKQDYFNLDYLQNDNFEWSNSENTKSKKPLGPFFRHKAAAYEFQNPDFNLVINPITYLSAGYDNRLKETILLNNRGLEIRGSIKGVVGFYTQFSDEINTPHSWVMDYYHKDSVIPGVGFMKTDDLRTFNYWLASGYITFDVSKYIDIQFGHGSNFLGNGYRSFYLSDFSRNHFFTRINTHIWKINYTNIWGMMYDYTNPNQRNQPKRHYYATTHLSMNFTKNFNLGIFQTISYQRDSGYANGGMDVEYLNPIILYKPIENGLNSPDKAILGLDMKYNFLQHFSAYGQFVISEFVMDEVLAANGWWGNKMAVQAGLKYIDAFGVQNLDLQAEYNVCRPYMYTSFDSKNAWANYNQNMAHPYGANFREWIGVVRFQPMNRVFLKATFNYSYYGNDTANSNWGKDIRKSYTNPHREYGNYIGQGVRTDLLLTDLMVSWMVKHNVFLDFQVYYRKTSSDDIQFRSEAIFINTSLRWNIAERRYDF